MSKTISKNRPSLKEKKLESKITGLQSTNNDKIILLTHDFYKKDDKVLGVNITVNNISEQQIGLALFKVDFYNLKREIFDTVEYKIEGLKPGISKTFHITSAKHDKYIIDSYLIEIIKITVIQTPKAIGNNSLYVLKHELYTADMIPRGPNSDGAKLVIKNPLDKTISNAVFNVKFFDIENNVVCKFEHRESNIKPGNSRQIFIFPSKPTRYALKSYDINVIRVTTADVEKVQICGHEIKTNETGEEEVTGTVKNLFSAKTDAILIATFYNKDNSAIGSKAVILRDLEPDSINKFSFKFQPQEGEKIRTYNLKVVCDIDENQ